MNLSVYALAAKRGQLSQGSRTHRAHHTYDSDPQPHQIRAHAMDYRPNPDAHLGVPPRRLHMGPHGRDYREAHGIQG
ncbi:hypothetical protein JMUB6875_19500 [Nocardia sp. JMUB6875]